MELDEIAGWLLSGLDEGNVEVGMRTRAEEKFNVVANSVMSLHYKTWDFGDAVGFDALCHAGEVTKREDLIRFCYGWVSCWANKVKAFSSLDCTAPGRVMVSLGQRYRDAQLLGKAIELADYLLCRRKIGGVYVTHERSPLVEPAGGGDLDPSEVALLISSPPGVFVDCLYCDPPFFASLWRATGEEKYLRAALEQAIGYVHALQREDGLFEHFRLEGIDSRFGGAWGRGQGWALLGLLTTLQIAEGVVGGDPDVTGKIDRLRQAVRGQVDAMVECQRADGHWYAVVDEPGSGDEYSTTAFMVYGFHKALELGIGDCTRIGNAVANASEALLSGLEEGGILRQVSAAVMACTNPVHYYKVPKGFVVPWGQGPALLAVTEMVR